MRRPSVRSVAQRSALLRAAGTRPCRPVPSAGTFIGRRVDTGAPVVVPFPWISRGVEARGGLGTGKTALLRKFLMTFGLKHNVLHFDYSGTGDFYLQTWIAVIATILAAASRRLPLLKPVAARFLTRWAFACIGEGREALPIRIDLLKPRLLADGDTETVPAVVQRAFYVFEVKLNTIDPQVRVLFRRVATAVLTCLVAAGRPISEGLQMLDDPVFAAFVFRTIEGRRFEGDEAVFIAYQLTEMRRILTVHDPAKPTTYRTFMDLTNSTRNAFADFAPGSILGRFLGSDETFAPESVAFGTQGFSLTSTLVDPTLRAQGFQGVHAIFDTLFRSRRQSKRVFAPVSVFTDELLWLPRRISDVLAVARNFDVSYLLAYQDSSQWADLGLPQMAQQIQRLTSLRITMRPETLEEAKMEALLTHWIRPDGLVQRFFTESTSEGTSTADTISDAFAETTGEAESTGDARSESELSSDSDGEGESEHSTSSESHSSGETRMSGGSFGSSLGWEEIFGTLDVKHSGRTMEGSSHGFGETSMDGFSSSSGTGQNRFRSHTDGNAKGWVESSSHTKSRSRTEGRTEGRTEAEQHMRTVQEVLNILSPESQLLLLAQQALRRERRLAHVTYEGEAFDVALAPPVEYPAEICGIDVREQYQAAQRTLFLQRAQPRLPFSRTILLPAADLAGTEDLVDIPPTPGTQTPDPAAARPHPARGRKHRRSAVDQPEEPER